MLYLPLRHSDKLNRLIAFYHGRTEAELTNVALATILGQRLQMEVSPETIQNARAGTDVLPEKMSHELCIFMGIDPAYLCQSGDGEDRRIDKVLTLWTLARDRGLEHLAVRAGYRDPNVIDRLIAELEATPPVVHAVASAST